jgi:putative PIN family toxin of toxin-antitoxin system
MQRVVLDTNVIIDAWFNGVRECRDILYRECNGEFKMVSSNYTTEEMIAVVKALILNGAFQIQEIVTMYSKLLRLYRRSDSIEPINHVNYIADDDSDNNFLDCAIEGNANVLVTSNFNHFGDVVNLKNINDELINICNPLDFINILETKVAVNQ